MKPTRRQLVAALMVAAVAVGVAAMPSSAAERSGVLEVGWWTQDLRASAVHGGMVVGQGAGRPLSVAAIRIGVAESADLSITLSATGGLAQDMSHVVGCLTTVPWTASQGGSLDAAPAVSCGQARTAELSASEPDVWRMDLRKLLENVRHSTVSVALVPALYTTPVDLVPWELQLGPPVLRGPVTVAAPRIPENVYQPPDIEPSHEAIPDEGRTPLESLPAHVDVNVATPTRAPDPAVALSEPAPDDLAVEPVGASGRPLGQAALFVLLALVSGIAGGLFHLKTAGEGHERED